MEEFYDIVDNLDLTFDADELIACEQGSSNLDIAAPFVTKNAMDVEAFLHIHRKNWTSAGGLDLKKINRWIFVFYFEDGDELELVLKKAP